MSNEKEIVFTLTSIMKTISFIVPNIITTISSILCVVKMQGVMTKK